MFPGWCPPLGCRRPAPCLGSPSTCGSSPGPRSAVPGRAGRPHPCLRGQRGLVLRLSGAADPPWPATAVVGQRRWRDHSRRLGRAAVGSPRSRATRPGAGHRGVRVVRRDRQRRLGLLGHAQPARIRRRLRRRDRRVRRRDGHGVTRARRVGGPLASRALAHRRHQPRSPPSAPLLLARPRPSSSPAQPGPQRARATPRTWSARTR